MQPLHCWVIVCPSCFSAEPSLSTSSFILGAEVWKPAGMMISQVNLGGWWVQPH